MSETREPSEDTLYTIIECLSNRVHNLGARIEERDTKIANQAVVITKLEVSRKDMKKENEKIRAELKHVNEVVDIYQEMFEETG